MRVLYITQYFPPEIGAGASRAYEMSMHLSQLGHRVTVLTEFPTYPSGVVPSDYRGKLVSVEKMEGVTVLRVWTYPTKRQKVVQRLINYVSFMCLSVFLGLHLRNVDLIYATTPTPFTGLSGYLLSRINRAKFVYEVRDLWPEFAVELGVLRNRLAIRMGMRLAEFCYSKADLIIPVTQGIQNDLARRGFGNKTTVVRNGVNTDLFRDGTGLREELGLKGKFVAIFAGVLGFAGGVERLIESAKILYEEGFKDIHFLFVGNGVEKDRLVRKAKKYALDNVIFVEPQAEQRLPLYINSADAGLATLRNCKFAHGAIPTKMLTYMACERPVVLGIHGEAEDIIENAQAGIAVEPEDPQQLANAILKLYGNRDLAREMGKRGRQFVVEHFSRKDQAKKLERALVRL